MSKSVAETKLYNALNDEEEAVTPRYLKRMTIWCGSQSLVAHAHCKRLCGHRTCRCFLNRKVVGGIYVDAKTEFLDGIKKGAFTRTG